MSNIRNATIPEHDAMLDVFAFHAGQPVEELPECSCYIREGYITDGPGYRGKVGLLHWHGSPHLVTTFLEDVGGKWLMFHDVTSYADPVSGVGELLNMVRENTTKAYRRSKMNRDRAEWAREGIAAFAKKTGMTYEWTKGSPEDRASVISDLLCDLMHYSAVAGHEATQFPALLAKAASDFQAEADIED